MKFGQVPEALKEMMGPYAPDVSIEAVGIHYCKSWVHKFEMATMLETDPSETLNEIIFCTRKARCYSCLSKSYQSNALQH